MIGPNPAADCKLAARDYWRRLGWPAHAHGRVVWIVPGGQIEALNMPRDIAAPAIARLAAIGVVGPVIEIPGQPARWALLSQPHAGSPSGILRVLAQQEYGHQIGYAHGGRHRGQPSEWGIDLPPTRYPDRQPLTWIKPATQPLPPISLVLGAVLDVLLSRQGDRRAPAEDGQ
ncbi:MAG TPA: hypothetical protein VHX38_27055 [Pseudonocardiaceae bacterium]|jgi:hypothetical protein|nr:hypothetical protein [Pseudonocardiaceae bacterium]